MEVENFLDEVLVVALEFLTVLLEVEYGSGLRLDFVDVSVVHARYLI